MINKISQHFNKGMNRDISDSKVNNEFAFENHNIRITENNGDTLLSITNEKGNIELPLYSKTYGNQIFVENVSIERGGQSYIAYKFRAERPVVSEVFFKGTSSPNHNTVYFSIKPGGTEVIVNPNGLAGLNRTWLSLSKEEDITRDQCYLYYIEDPDIEFPIVEEKVINDIYCGHCIVNNYITLFTYNETSNLNYIYKIYKDGEYYICDSLFKGDLNIRPESPVECVGDYQTSSIINVYWTDGVNQPRVINILSNSPFISNGVFDFAPLADDKCYFTCVNNYDNHGQFPSGTIQYFVTGVGYNRNESSILASSNIIHLKNRDRGLSPDEEYNFSVDVQFIISNKSEIFEKYILYSIIHTSENTEPIARKVTEFYTENLFEYTDTGNVGETISSTDLLYKGAQEISAQTIDSKDNTLFLGNIDIKSTKISDELLSMLKDTSNYIVSQETRNEKLFKDDIYSVDNSGEQQSPYLRNGNYYRIGIQFKDSHGKWTSAFYLGDYQIENKPTITDNVSGNDLLTVPTLMVTISNDEMKQMLIDENFVSFRVLIVLPSDTDKVVLFQGVLNENVVNIGDHNSGVSDADSSWFFRPIYNESSYADPNIQESRPYHPLRPANSLAAEIQTQDWEDYEYCYNNDIKSISQYLIEPTLLDIYSPDFRNYQGNLVWDNVYLSLAGRCWLDNSETNTIYNSRVNINSPIGINSNVARFIPNLKNNNVSAAFIDGFYFDYGEYIKYSFLPNAYKVRLADLINDNKSDIGLVYAIYPWHRDSSLNNDIPREGRTALFDNKVFSKYNFFKTYFLDEKVDSIGIDSPLYFFDNNQDFLIIKDNGNNTIKYRGNLNTIVSNKHYPSPIRIGKFNDYESLTYYDGDSVETISSQYLRNSSLSDFPNQLVWLDGYGLDSNNQDYFGDDAAVIDLSSDIEFNTTNSINSMDPVSIKYKTANHGVFKLNNPIWFSDENVDTNNQTMYGAYFVGKVNSKNSDLVLDKTDSELNSSEPFTDGILWLVDVKQNVNTDSIFGGKTEFALSNNVWIPASKEVYLSDNINYVSINTGDTYLIRWDVLKTFPYASGDKNSIVEIGSFLIESYNNNKSRYDRNIRSNDYSVMNETNFGLYNDVYNQKDNFFTYRYFTDEYLKTNKFPNQFIWSLEHTPGADIDNWTNLSYGSYYNVNGDNGEIRAIRRYGDTLIGFQDSGIFQIMFNSRTQISTTNGLPIELANSGKVDGVRYLTEKEGCINKWTIKVTPNGLYFIDDLNYSINTLQGSSLRHLSDELGFAQWCKDNIEPYKMWNINNGGFRTYYDRILNDVYFTYGDKSLVYSEKLGQFMSFIDYPSNYAMDNLNDSFLSFNTSLWENHSGDYNSFFGEPKDFYVKYRIAPDPYINKTFNNIEYVATGNNRTSNYTDLIVDGVNQTGSSDLTLRPILPAFNLQKKFNVWRANIPRENGAVLNRIQSPWIYLTLKSDKNKRRTEDKIELHNLLVKYSV